MMLDVQKFDILHGHFPTGHFGHVWTLSSPFQRARLRERFNAAPHGRGAPEPALFFVGKNPQRLGHPKTLIPLDIRGNPMMLENSM